ncbi:MAG: hypothetical protein M0Z42_04800 [Actinomycetota bacterium]|nr:hypothetical protein [Actinomycetota bacterium]
MEDPPLVPAGERDLQPTSPIDRRAGHEEAIGPAQGTVPAPWRSACGPAFAPADQVELGARR